MRARWVWLGGVVACAGCLSIAGLDEDYRLGEASSSATAGATTGGGATTVSAGGNSSSTGGMAATGGTTGSGGGSTEDCLDGLDNDENGLVDCADPFCQPDHECVPLPDVPTDWTGYYVVDTQSYPAAPPSPCPDSANPEILYAGPGAQAQCSACSCDAPSGSCSYPEMGLWTNTSSCSGGPDYLMAPGDGNCHDFPVDCGSFCSNDQRVRITQSSVLDSTASCTPSGGVPTLPPLWSDEHHACTMQASGGGGCGTGMACVSQGGGFGGACVRREGENACPGRWPRQLLAYASADDERDCSACSCDPSPVACSGGSFIASDDGACMGGTTPDITVSGTSCVSMQQILDGNAASYRAVAGTLSGSCGTSGGDPVGAVTPQDPVTFCCL